MKLRTFAFIGLRSFSALPSPDHAAAGTLHASLNWTLWRDDSRKRRLAVSQTKDAVMLRGIEFERPFALDSVPNACNICTCHSHLLCPVAAPMRITDIFS